MSGKSRVYQGVRVRTTVKELLQMHREKVANSKKYKTVYLEHKELCESTAPSRHADPPPAVPLTDASSCRLRAVPLHTYSFPMSDSSCTIQMPASTFNHTQQQFEEVMLPSNGYNNNNSTSGTLDYSTSLPPLSASSPLCWGHGISSDTDYYGHGMAAASSSESLTFCNSLDPNSYSPQDSFSSSSSSCYDSPTRMECSYAFSSEHHCYQHCNPHQDCWLGQQEGFPTAEFPPFYDPTDYPSAGPVEEGYFRKDFPLSSEMCYKVL
ncbi:colorectal cancer associated 2 isoform X2 [Melanotaenia boesemani]|uniref:colorectal cancer associated 2 isoform X2 n=1 Tax=Melanotaenia boesemani TaxID=1250792 RepID=UPI001C05983C|nr:colorectal cancer associated 2 isoform X2 [Melanotaenia boesemani]